MFTPMSPYLLSHQLISSYQHNCAGKSVNMNFIGKFKTNFEKTFPKVSPNVGKDLNEAQLCAKAGLKNVLNTAAMRDVACKGDCTAVIKCKNDQHNLSAIHLFPGNADVQIPLIVGLRIYHHEKKSTECWEERLI